jgi:hypothetical protein
VDPRNHLFWSPAFRRSGFRLKPANLAGVDLVEAVLATTDPSNLSYLLQGLADLAGKNDPKLAAPLAEKLVEAMRVTTDANQLRALAQGLFDLKNIQSVSSPQTVVSLLKQPRAVMPLLEFSAVYRPHQEYPRSLMDCLLAYLGRGLRKEPFPDLQSFLSWAKAHSEADLDLDSPPEPLIKD